MICRPVEGSAKEPVFTTADEGEPAIESVLQTWKDAILKITDLERCNFKGGELVHA
jgi:hypothetical protein